MNIEIFETSRNPNLYISPDESTSQQLRIEPAESTATNPLRQSLDCSHQVISMQQEDKKILPPNQKSQSEPGMGLYIANLLAKPIAEEVEDKDIADNKQEEQEEAAPGKESKGEIIELNDLCPELIKNDHDENEPVEETDRLQGALEIRIVLPEPESVEQQQAQEQYRPVVHELWMPSPSESRRAFNNEENGNVGNQQPRRQGSRSNNSRRGTPRLRHQHFSAPTTVLGQVEDMNYEAWLDFDSIQAQEDRELQQRISQAVDGRYYKKLGLIFAELILFLLAYLVTINVFSLQVLIAVIAIIFVIVTIYSLSHIKRGDFQDGEERWKVLMVIDWICYAQFGLFLTLKLQGNLNSNLYFNVIPGFIVILLYLTAVEPPKRKRVEIIASRILSWIQLLIVCLKIDEIVDINWNLTFIVSWFAAIALVVSTIIAIGFFVINVYIFFKGSSSTQPRAVPVKWQLITVTITFLLLLVSVFLLAILISFTKYMDGDDEEDHYETLEGACLAALVYATVMFCVAVIFKKILREFYNHEVTSLPEFKPAPGQRVLAYKSQDLKGRNVFYTMISPTYYMLFDQSLLLNEEQNVKKLKTYMISLKDKAKAVINKKILNRKVTLEDLKKEVKIKKISKAAKLETKPTNKDISLQIISENDIEHGQTESENIKLSLSTDDKERIGSFKALRNAALNIEEAEEVEQTCFICYERGANAIFLGCGHGGVCFECAQETWNKKSTCISCRERITEIVKLAPVKGMRMARAVSKTKKVYEILRSRTFVSSNY